MMALWFKAIEIIHVMSLFTLAQHLSYIYMCAVCLHLG